LVFYCDALAYFGNVSKGFQFADGTVSLPIVYSDKLSIEDEIVMKRAYLNAGQVYARLYTPTLHFARYNAGSAMRDPAGTEGMGEA